MYVTLKQYSSYVRHGVHMEWTNLNYVVHSSEPASGLVVDTKLKPCTLNVHKGVTFRHSTTVYTPEAWFDLDGLWRAFPNDSSGLWSVIM